MRPRLYGEYFITARERGTDRVVFAQVFDNIAHSRRAIASIVRRYPNDRFFVQFGRMPEDLPSLAGHPHENVTRIADLYQVPLNLLVEAQRAEEPRSKDWAARFRFRLVKHAYLLAAFALAAAASASLYQARRLNIVDVLNAYGALALVLLIAVFWCVWRYSYEKVDVFIIGGLLLLVAAFGDTTIGAFVCGLIRIAVMLVSGQIRLEFDDTI